MCNGIKEEILQAKGHKMHNIENIFNILKYLCRYKCNTPMTSRTSRK